MTSELAKAMKNPDDLVVVLEYKDSKGKSTRRVVSPIRFLGQHRFLGLCLCRCEPRQFSIARCSRVEIQPAYNFLMPVPIETVDDGIEAQTVSAA